MSDLTPEQQRDWRVVLPKGALLKLRENPAFHDILCLARACNVLRFALEAGTAIEHDSVATANRQRVNTYLHVAAALSEALRLCERLPSTLGEIPTFAALKAFTKRADILALDAGPLRTLRDKSVYHHDRKVPRDALARFDDGEYRFAEGGSESVLAPHYILADLLALDFVLGSADGSATTDKLDAAMTETLNASTDFLVLADGVIASFLMDHGATVEYLPRAG